MAQRAQSENLRREYRIFSAVFAIETAEVPERFSTLSVFVASVATIF